jgi:AraC family transcriptional activator of pobA
MMLNRRDIPEYAMNAAGPEALRSLGVLAMPFMESVRDDPRRLKPHFHEFYQMYLLRGEATVMMDFEEFEVAGVNAVFVTPGQVHTVRMSERLEGFTVSFTQAFFDDEAPPPSRLLEYPFFFPDGTAPWLPLQPDQPMDQEVVKLFEEMEVEYRRGLADSGEMLRATLRLLLVKMNRLARQGQDMEEAASGAAKGSRSKTLVRQFYLLLEKHFRELVRLPDYAAKLGVTPNHLNDVIREHTRHAAGDLIRRRRLLDAKRRLLYSELSVSEIGFELGFDDPSYFTRFFRRYEKVTPSEFREQIREKYH